MGGQPLPCRSCPTSHSLPNSQSCVHISVCRCACSLLMCQAFGNRMHKHYRYPTLYPFTLSHSLIQNLLLWTNSSFSRSFSLCLLASVEAHRRISTGERLSAADEHILCDFACQALASSQRQSTVVTHEPQLFLLSHFTSPNAMYPQLCTSPCSFISPLCHSPPSKRGGTCSL